MYMKTKSIKAMSYEELLEERRLLEIEYSCWMDRNDFDILEEIEMEIYAVDKLIKKAEAK